MNPFRDALVTISVSLLGACSSSHADDAQPSVQDGVFTAEQAQRGDLLYRSECASCHAADMRGGPAARGLTGVTFQYRWKEKTLGELFDAMRDTMPPGMQGTLDEQAYLDLLAAILRRNDFPTGGKELEADRQLLGITLVRWRRPD